MKSRAVSTSKITLKTLCLAQTVGEQNRGNTHFHTKGCRTIEHSFDESTCVMNPQMAIRKPVSPITRRMYLPGRKEAAFRDLWRPIGLGDDGDGAFWRHLEPFSAILAVFLSVRARN